MTPGIHYLDAEEARLVRERRERKRRDRERRESNARAALRFRALLAGTTWQTREGDLVPVSRMTPRHAQNALRFAVDLAHRYRLAATLAGDALDRTADPVSADRWPLLLALTARANEEPSLRDRLVDNRNRRRFERNRTR